MLTRRVLLSRPGGGRSSVHGWQFHERRICHRARASSCAGHGLSSAAKASAQRTEPAHRGFIRLPRLVTVGEIGSVHIDVDSFI